MSAELKLYHPVSEESVGDLVIPIGSSIAHRLETNIEKAEHRAFLAGWVLRGQESGIDGVTAYQIWARDGDKGA